MPIIKLRSLLSEARISKDFIKIITDAGFELHDTPRDRHELEKLFSALPRNGEIVFFDYDGLTKQINPKDPEVKKYSSGVPAYAKITKELSNAMNQDVLIFVDNRLAVDGDGVTYKMDKVPDLAAAIARQASLLNKYGIKVHRVDMPSLAPGIGPHRGTKIRTLKP